MYNNYFGDFPRQGDMRAINLDWLIAKVKELEASVAAQKAAGDTLKADTDSALATMNSTMATMNSTMDTRLADTALSGIMNTLLIGLIAGGQIPGSTIMPAIRNVPAIDLAQCVKTKKWTKIGADDTVVLVGDSVVAGFGAMSPETNAGDFWKQACKPYGNTFYNRAIGGTRCGDFINSDYLVDNTKADWGNGTSWIAQVTALSPDYLIVAFGVNEVFSDSSYRQFYTAAQIYNLFPNIKGIIFCTNSTASTDPTKIVQPRDQFINNAAWGSRLAFDNLPQKIALVDFNKIYNALAQPVNQFMNTYADYTDYTTSRKMWCEFDVTVTQYPFNVFIDRTTIALTDNSAIVIRGYEDRTELILTLNSVESILKTFAYKMPANFHVKWYNNKLEFGQETEFINYCQTGTIALVNATIDNVMAWDPNANTYIYSNEEMLVDHVHPSQFAYNLVFKPLTEYAMSVLHE